MEDDQQLEEARLAEAPGLVPAAPVHAVEDDDGGGIDAGDGDGDLDVEELGVEAGRDVEGLEPRGLGLRRGQGGRTRVGRKPEQRRGRQAELDGRTRGPDPEGVDVDAGEHVRGHRGRRRGEEERREKPAEEEKEKAQLSPTVSAARKGRDGWAEGVWRRPLLLGLAQLWACVDLGSAGEHAGQFFAYRSVKEDHPRKMCPRYVFVCQQRERASPPPSSSRDALPFPWPSHHVLRRISLDNLSI